MKECSHVWVWMGDEWNVLSVGGWMTRMGKYYVSWVETGGSTGSVGRRVGGVEGWKGGWMDGSKGGKL